MMRSGPYHIYLHTLNSQNGRILERIIAAFGLKQMEAELRSDPDIVVCRAEQLAKLEGDKLVDKVASNYSFIPLNISPW